jgi:hypothetical protein
MGSILSDEVADMRCLKQMIAHLSTCTECAKVGMLVANACRAGALATAAPSETTAPRGKVIPLVRRSRPENCDPTGVHAEPGASASPPHAA